MDGWIKCATHTMLDKAVTYKSIPWMMGMLELIPALLGHSGGSPNREDPGSLDQESNPRL